MSEEEVSVVFGKATKAEYCCGVNEAAANTGTALWNLFGDKIPDFVYLTAGQRLAFPWL